jgi:hypothetical protein
MQSNNNSFSSEVNLQAKQSCSISDAAHSGFSVDCGMGALPDKPQEDSGQNRENSWKQRANINSAGA